MVKLLLKLIMFCASVEICCNVHALPFFLILCWVSSTSVTLPDYNQLFNINPDCTCSSIKWDHDFVNGASLYLRINSSFPFVYSISNFFRSLSIFGFISGISLVMSKIAFLIHEDQGNWSIYFLTPSFGIVLPFILKWGLRNGSFFLVCEMILIFLCSLNFVLGKGNPLALVPPVVIFCKFLGCASSLSLSLSLSVFFKFWPLYCCSLLFCIIFSSTSTFLSLVCVCSYQIMQMWHVYFSFAWNISVCFLHRYIQPVFIFSCSIFFNLPL